MKNRTFKILIGILSTLLLVSCNSITVSEQKAIEEVNSIEALDMYRADVLIQ